MIHLRHSPLPVFEGGGVWVRVGRWKGGDLARDVTTRRRRGRRKKKGRGGKRGIDNCRIE